jgi:hypothetical protein
MLARREIGMAKQVRPLRDGEGHRVGFGAEYVRLHANELRDDFWGAIPE